LCRRWLLANGDRSLNPIAVAASQPDTAQNVL
jgi:hypothetical protein